MSHRPWPIVVIAIFHIFAPLFNLWTSAKIMSMPLSLYVMLITNSQTWEVLVWIILPILAGIALLTFRMWSYYAFLTFMCGAVGFTFYQWIEFPKKISPIQFLAYELINFIVIAYFLSPRCRQIYLNARIRWWQQKPRFIVTWPGTIKSEKGQDHFTMDNISEGGALITTGLLLNNQDTVTIHFEAYGEPLKVSAQVVHHHNQKCGLLFNYNMESLRKIKRLIKKLHKLQVPVRHMGPVGFESFKIWCKGLLTGKGFMP